MTVSSSTNKVSYAGNGLTLNFAVNFYFLENSHLKVILRSSDGTESVQTLTTNYTVTGAGNPAGGSVAMLVAPPSGSTLVIVRNVPATQETDYLANDPFPAESHERALDKLTMLVQENEEVASRALVVPASTPTTVNTTLPNPTSLGILAWNQNANAINYISPSDIGTAVAYATAYADTFDCDGVDQTFTLTANPAVINNLDVSLQGSTQVPNVDYTLSGTTLTMTTPPPLNTVLLVKYKEGLPNFSGDSQDVRYVPAGTGAVQTTVQAKLRETVSVKDFGAVGDGVTDDTEAFRQACLSYQAVTAATANRAIYVPAGKYKITDTVYVHAGNVLFGDGMATSIDAASFGAVTNSVFKLGWWLNGSTPTQDTGVGDLPPEIYNFFTVGGPSGGGAVVDLTFPGGIIHDMWFAAPGTAIILAGGNVFDCLVDGGLTGIVVNGANQRIDNVQFFNPNFGISLNGTCADTSIQNCSFEYVEYEAISVNGAGCEGVKIVSCNFFYNVQYATISGAIRLRNNNQTVNVESCQFTNMKGPAIVLEQTGVNKKLHVQSCVFNGEKSLAAYTQSTTSAGVYIQSGQAIIQSCRFINLRGYAFSLGSTLAGNYADCVLSSCVISATDTTIVANDIGIFSTQYGDSLKLNGVTGSGNCPLFAANVYCYPLANSLQNWFQIENTPGTNFVRLPTTHGASFHVKMRVNTLQSGSFDYIKNIYEIIDVSTGFNGVTQESQINTQVIYASPTTAPVPDIALTAGFTSIAGPTTLTPPIVGYIILSWPDTYGVADLNIQIN